MSFARTLSSRLIQNARVAKETVTETLSPMLQRATAAEAANGNKAKEWFVKTRSGRHDAQLYGEAHDLHQPGSYWTSPDLMDYTQTTKILQTAKNKSLGRTPISFPQ